MTVLLIGGCGFIGSYIASDLATKGIPVVVFDRNANDANDSAGIRHVRGEFGNRGELERTIVDHRITEVIHCVSSTLPKSSNEDPEFDVSSNVCESVALLNFCVRHAVRKVVYLSSGGTVYGIPRYNPIDEQHPTDPICSYGITKLAIEKYLALYHRLHGLDYAIVRPANPYGIGQSPFRDQGIIAVFLHRLLHGQKLHVWGDGHTIRDYVHVRDVASLCRRALAADFCGICNAGSGTGTSIRQLIALLASVLDLEPDVVWESGRAFDVPEIVLSTEAARTRLQWVPKISLDDGVKEFAQWMRDNPSVAA